MNFITLIMMTGVQVIWFRFLAVYFSLSMVIFCFLMNDYLNIMIYMQSQIHERTYTSRRRRVLLRERRRWRGQGMEWKRAIVQIFDVSFDDLVLRFSFEREREREREKERERENEARICDDGTECYVDIVSCKCISVRAGVSRSWIQQKPVELRILRRFERENRRRHVRQ